MDPNGRIYEDDPERIPAEDKARLDGYLKARAEKDRELMQDIKTAALEAKVREMEEAQEASKDAPQ